MSVIITDEILSETRHNRSLALIRREHSLKQTRYAVANKMRICRQMMRRITVLLQSMIGRLPQIGNRIEQRPVKIKYHQFLLLAIHNKIIVILCFTVRRYHQPLYFVDILLR